jgi:hypothetical protein
MTGLVPVIHAVKPEFMSCGWVERLTISALRRRHGVDGHNGCMKQHKRI